MTDEFDVTMASGYQVPGRRKNKWDATAAPAVTDDAADGYSVGSLWIDTTADRVYVCTDPTSGAAVWVEISGGGTDDQTAAEVPFTPAGTIAAADVQAALEELDGDITALPDLTSLLIDASVSGAVDVDRDAAATHDLTLTGNATLTPIHSAAVAGEAIDLRLLIRQDGTGGWTLAWGGTISWVGGAEPTMPTDPDALLTVGLLSVDDATTWLGYVADAAGVTLSDTVADETTWGITPDAGVSTEAARGDHTHGSPAEPTGSGGGGIGPLLLASDHSTPIVFGDILQASDGSDFLNASEP